MGGSTASLKPIPAAAAELNSAPKVEPAAPDSLRATGGAVVPAIDAPLQVDIQGRFVEIRGSLPPELVGVLSSNRSSVRLTAAATRGLIKVFEERDGIDFLTAPRMTTLSNRGAEISVSDVRVIDGKNAGPTLQVIPAVSNPAIELSVFASMVQVHGGGPDSNGASGPLVQTNLVWVRERSWIWDGQSVLIDVGALTNRVQFVDKVVQPGRFAARRPVLPQGGDSRPGEPTVRPGDPDAHRRHRPPHP